MRKARFGRVHGSYVSNVSCAVKNAIVIVGGMATATKASKHTKKVPNANVTLI